MDDSNRQCSRSEIQDSRVRQLASASSLKGAATRKNIKQQKANTGNAKHTTRENQHCSWIRPRGHLRRSESVARNRMQSTKLVACGADHQSAAHIASTHRPRLRECALQKLLVGLRPHERDKQKCDERIVDSFHHSNPRKVATRAPSHTLVPLIVKQHPSRICQQVGSASIIVQNCVPRNHYKVIGER